VTDVAFKFARQVLDRCEDPAGNELALDSGEPIFDLVEPGGISRSVVELDGGVRREELLNPLGLVRRELVGNEMNLLAARLIGDHLGEECNVGDTKAARTCRPLLLPSAVATTMCEWTTGFPW
jgi:hypothetical protein